MTIPPKTQVHETLSCDNFEVDLAEMQCKFRWEVQKTEEEKLTDEEELSKE